MIADLDFEKDLGHRLGVRDSPDVLLTAYNLVLLRLGLSQISLEFSPVKQLTNTSSLEIADYNRAASTLILQVSQPDNISHQQHNFVVN